MPVEKVMLQNGLRARFEEATVVRASAARDCKDMQVDAAHAFHTDCCRISPSKLNLPSLHQVTVAVLWRHNTFHS